MSFSVSDYDCIGFDLDHTVCRYKLDNLSALIYSTLCRYLIEKKGYDKEVLRPFDKGQDFLLKGLMLDMKRGNLLKVGKSGTILRASHGTKMMSLAKIREVYGTNRLWQPLLKFKTTLYERHGRLAKEIRSFIDYFDMPAALVAANLVDLVDRRNGSAGDAYDVWPDLLDGLIDMYKVEGFAEDTGGFFPALKERVEDYVVPCSDAVKTWLRHLRQEKRVFLLTGSKVDFAAHLLRHCLGADWDTYFDVIVTYARKPGFFTGHRPFLDVAAGDKPVVEGELKRFHTYSQGNYVDLVAFLGGIAGKNDPRILYVGDNLIQDVFTPAKYSRCHTVAVLEELEAEGMLDCPDVVHPTRDYITSSKWGSFFFDDDAIETGDSTVSGPKRINTLWADVLLTHSQITIPHLDALAAFPVNAKLSSFNMAHPDMPSGFYPSDPKILHTDL